MKALYYGVPMVLVPWGRDQPGVAARAECSEGRITQAVFQVLTEPRYKETVERVAHRLQSEDALAQACRHVEALFRSAA